MNTSAGILGTLIASLAFGAALLAGASVFAAFCVASEVVFAFAVLSALLSAMLRRSDRGMSAAVFLLLTWIIVDAGHISLFRKRLDTRQIREYVDALRTGVLPFQPEMVLLPLLVSALAALVTFALLKKYGQGKPRAPLRTAIALTALIAITSERSLTRTYIPHAKALRLLPWRSLPEAALPERALEMNELPRVQGEAANAQMFAQYVKRTKEARTGPAVKATRPLDIVIFHVESLRGDTLERGLTPKLAKLKERCMVPAKHYSTGNNTGSSMFGLLFGLNGYYYPSARAAQTIPPPLEALKRAGYTLHTHLTGHLKTFDGLSFWYFDRVVDDRHYYEDSDDRSALDRAAVDAFVASLATRGEEPHFDYITLDSTHYDYVFPKEFEKFTPVGKLTGIPIRDQGQNPVTIENAYKNAVGWLDTLLDNTLERIQKTGRDKRMLIVITGDHGESFWEHQSFGHGAVLTDEETRTAFFLCAPQSQTTRYEVSSHADLMPTLFDFIGLPPPAPQWTTGKSLTSYERSLDYALLSYGDPDNRHHRFTTPTEALLFLDGAKPYSTGERGNETDASTRLLQALAAKVLH
jgi:glucan phosphoethanolaminetransferase (alkaline phosphatase superfamily)